MNFTFLLILCNKVYSQMILNLFSVMVILKYFQTWTTSARANDILDGDNGILFASHLEYGHYF